MIHSQLMLDIMNVSVVLQSALCEHVRIHLAVAGNKVKRISGID